MSGGLEPGEFEGLLAKAQSGNTNAQIQLLQCMRQNKVHQPDIVIVYGGRLLRDCPRKLGDERWSVLEQVFLAALELGAEEWPEYCLKRLQDKFPSSVRVKRLQGMYFESQNSWDDAKAIYDSIIQEKPEDTYSHKRKIAIHKQQGHIDKCIEAINLYLETFSTDAEVWQELGELYIEAGSIQRGTFCFEELLLSNPRSMYHVLTYAELLYSSGQSAQDLEMSRKYYCLALHLDAGCLRALWGLVAVCTATQLQKKDESNEKMQQLLEFAIERLRAAYKAIPGPHAKVSLALLDAAATPYAVLNPA